MQNTDKTLEILTQEIETLSSEELYNLFMFYYKINYQHENIATLDQFTAFLESFEQNPFHRNEDKAFKKQMTESLITYTHDHMSLITAVMLIKRKFTVEEIVEHYYSNINVFDNNLF